jgi:plexin A
MTLLAELIEKSVITKNNPRILFRRNESVAEKMLSNWFAFLLFDFIRDCAGTPLYILFLSIKQQIYKGPVDAITCEARYSLSEDKLIRQAIDYESMSVRVQLQQQQQEPADMTHEIAVKVLNCDTITQVKEKMLDAFFKGYPYSKRPHVDELDLIYIPTVDWNLNKNSAQSKLILYDEDKTSRIDADDSKRVNTLAHYKITNGALFYLVPPRQTYAASQQSAASDTNNYSLMEHIMGRSNQENMTLLSKSSKSSSSPPTYSKLSAGGDNSACGVNGGVANVYSIMNGSTVGLTEAAFPANPNQHRFNAASLINNYSNIYNQISQQQQQQQSVGNHANHKTYSTSNG